MPEDRNAGVRSPGALAAAPFIPKTTYRRIKRCFSFRKGRSALSLCSAVLVKPRLLRRQGGSVCRGRWEQWNKRHLTMQMSTFHEWFIYSFVHLFVAGQRTLSSLHDSPWMQEWGGMRQDYCSASEQNWVRTLRRLELWCSELSCLFGRTSGKRVSICILSVWEEGGRREGAKQGDKCLSVQKLESLICFWSNEVYLYSALSWCKGCIATSSCCPAACVCLFTCCIERFIANFVFIAYTPVEAEHGNTRGKRAKRRLDVLICQLKALKGNHMSETDTMSDSKVLGHLGWVGRKCFHNKDKKRGWLLVLF